MVKPFLRRPRRRHQLADCVEHDLELIVVLPFEARSVKA
jgi:hypothetical protein